MTGLCCFGIAVVVCVGWKGVWGLLSILVCCGVCFSVRVCCGVYGGSGACHVISCCGLWNDGVCCCVTCLCVFCVFSFSSSFLVVVFGVVRAQPCEHARYPRTPLCFFCLPVVALFSSFCTPLFFCVEWRWVIHHVSLCSVGMTAMGSLSRSSSFLW